MAALADEGALDGDLGVFGSILATDQYDTFLEELDALGIDPVAEAIVDAPPDDLTAQNQATAVIMENFESQGVDRVLAVGSAAVPLANGLAPLDYRPTLVFTSNVSVQAYTAGVAPDLSMFEGALLSSVDNALFDEPDMQQCVGIVEDAVGPIPDPDTLEDTDPNPFVSASAACRNLRLFQAIADAAGPDLDYGSFLAAGEQLTVHLPGAEADYEFGPYASRDGDLPMFVWDWDTAEEDFVVRD